ncbi:MAG: dTDP-4-dehydrorhamnose reductase [Candidatus Eisenbacteria bacterium]|nr:dTDP-4-dehydrorhamnose reductase [Candidatus Eisenbacteria bacterium]
MKILVTGARGMLGTDLCEILSAEHEVTGVDIEDVDISLASETGTLVKKISPQVVIHCAAYTDVDGSESKQEEVFRVNAEGTRNVAAACRETGSALVYLSTDYVFDGESPKPYRETDAPRPLNVYGSSKLEGERFVQRLVSQHVIVRTSWLFGLHGRNFVDTIIRLGQDEKTIEVVNDQVGCPTFTRDLCLALSAIVGSSDYGIYHVCNAGSCSWYDFAKRILELWGRSGARVVPSDSARVKRAATRPSFSVLDTSLFQKTFGFSLRDWKNALAEYVEFKKKRAAAEGAR